LYRVGKKEKIWQRELLIGKLFVFLQKIKMVILLMYHKYQHK